MAKIEVNYLNLREYAIRIDDHCDLQNQQMANANNAVKSVVGSEWYGEDAAEFNAKWNTLDDPDSTTVKLRESMKNYADALRACAQAYQSAQEDLYNQSVLLPRW